MELDFASTPEAEAKGRAIIKRLKDEYPSGKYFCICDCRDSSLTKERAEIWQSFEYVKIFFRDHSKVIFRTDHCPICGRNLPTPNGGKHSNGSKRI